MPDGRILIVDAQSEIGRWMTESVLQPAGYAFTQASTLMQVLELVSSFKPHVILLNAYIDSDLTVVKRVITEFDGSIPTIVFAERCSLDDLASMLQAGARDVLIFPIEPDRLLPSIAR
ncbi:MAG TPA: response regulator, partial [Anaerolineae bacterium]|nr:response regulator [Anaerolineae bacterium]